MYPIDKLPVPLRMRLPTKHRPHRPRRPRGGRRGSRKRTARRAEPPPRPAPVLARHLGRATLRPVVPRLQREAGGAVGLFSNSAAFERAGTVVSRSKTNGVRVAKRDVVDPDEERRKAVEKVLGEPVFLEFTESTARARRNLLFAGCLGIAFWYWGLKLTNSPSVLGLQVENLSPRVFVWGLLWALTYLLAHFLWLAWDSLQEWRLRRSGMKRAYPAGLWADPNADYPTDPRYSTLYRWWQERSREAGDLVGASAELRAAIEVFDASRDKGPPPGLDRAEFTTLLTQIHQLGEKLKAGLELQQSLRVPVSLERFDLAFRSFLLSQNLRWLLLEVGVPVGLGCLSISACLAMLSAPAAPPHAAGVQPTGLAIPAAQPIQGHSSNSGRPGSAKAPSL